MPAYRNWTKTTKWVHGENYDLPDGFDDGETIFFAHPGANSIALFRKGVFSVDEYGDPDPQGEYKEDQCKMLVAYENLPERTKDFFDKRNTGRGWFR